MRTSADPPKLRDGLPGGQIGPRAPISDHAPAVHDQEPGNVLDAVGLGDRVAVRDGDLREPESIDVCSRIAAAVFFRVDCDDLDASRGVVGLNLLQVRHERLTVRTPRRPKHDDRGLAPDGLWVRPVCRRNRQR